MDCSHWQTQVTHVSSLRVYISLHHACGGVPDVKPAADDASVRTLAKCVVRGFNTRKREFSFFFFRWRDESTKDWGDDNLNGRNLNTNDVIKDPKTSSLKIRLRPLTSSRFSRLVSSPLGNVSSEVPVTRPVMAVAHRGCVVAGYLFILLLAGCKARIHKLTLKVKWPVWSRHMLARGS